MKIASRPGRLLVSLLLLVLSFTASAADRTVYFVNDAQGSPVAAMDQQGEVLWRESYAPYGERRTKAADNNGKPAYTGKPEDADTSLVYMHARMYDPETARFTGIDPQGYTEDSPQSFGRYLYANNAPYVYVDPDGELPILIPILIFAAREVASEQVENATGIPLPTVKNAGKSAVKIFEKKGRVFWSGSSDARKAAESFAKANNKTTLEMTLTGKILDMATNKHTYPILKPFWDRASDRFAKGAEGVADVFHSVKGVRLKSVWATKEYPRLSAQGNPIKYHVTE